MIFNFYCILFFITIFLFQYAYSIDDTLNVINKIFQNDNQNQNDYSIGAFTTDPDGNIYFYSSFLIYKINSSSGIEIYAGGQSTFKDKMKSFHIASSGNCDDYSIDSVNHMKFKNGSLYIVDSAS